MTRPPGAALVCGIQKANIEEESKENLVSSTEFPWVVSLQDQKYTHLAFSCILSEFWILNSASALQDRLCPRGRAGRVHCRPGDWWAYTPPGVLT